MRDDPAPDAPRAANPTLRAVVDFGGLAVFLAAYLITRDMIVATWALVAGSAAALALGYAVERRLAPLPLFGGLAALIFGGLTLIFHDPIFIKIKATVINLALGSVMLGGWAMGRSPLKALFSSALELSEAGWRRLTLRFGLFYLCMAALNEAVWRTQPDETWVLFRFPGLQILSVLFALAQVPMMMRDKKALEQAADLEP